MGDHKEKYGKTRLGKFLDKAIKVAPELVDTGIKIYKGDFGGAIKEISSALSGKSSINPEAKKLLDELEANKLDYLEEVRRIDMQDRDSARNREVEKAKTGQIDYMFLLTGFCGLFSFMICVYAVIFLPDMQTNKLFIHLMGMVEGVVISGMFAYYFGGHKTRN